jgi:pimeloyl-ACP methyl ester carboxylesterase
MKKSLIILFLALTVSCKHQTTSINYGSNTAVGKYIEVNDIKLYYEVYGEGEPLILLHGNGGSIEIMDKQIPALSEKYKVIAIDSRAQGRSFDSDKEITYALMASDVSELIRKLNLKKVNVVGWSDGGNVALELAYAHPEQVIKAVASGANYSWQNYLEKSDTLTLSANDPLYKINKAFAIRYSSASGRLSQQKERLPVIRKKLTDLMDKYPNFTTAQLNTINIPFLVIAGDHDLINLEHTIQLYRNLPKGQLYILPATDHGAFILYPEIVNPEIIRFLECKYIRY